MTLPRRGIVSRSNLTRIRRLGNRLTTRRGRSTRTVRSATKNPLSTPGTKSMIPNATMMKSSLFQLFLQKPRNPKAVMRIAHSIRPNAEKKTSNACRNARARRSQGVPGTCAWTWAKVCLQCWRFWAQLDVGLSNVRTAHLPLRTNQQHSKRVPQVFCTASSRRHGRCGQKGSA